MDRSLGDHEISGFQDFRISGFYLGIAASFPRKKNPEILKS
jgi:hypothetical protein